MARNKKDHGWVVVNFRNGVRQLTYGGVTLEAAAAEIIRCQALGRETLLLRDVLKGPGGHWERSEWESLVQATYYPTGTRT